MLQKIKARFALVMIATFAILGMGALSTPASAYNTTHCLSPQTTWVNGYWKGVQQKCYVDYNWFEEVAGKSRDGYKVAYTWTENTLTGAKSNFKSYNLKYA